jgi:hypothetical protein
VVNEWVNFVLILTGVPKAAGNESLYIGPAALHNNQHLHETEAVAKKCRFDFRQESRLRVPLLI